MDDSKKTTEKVTADAGAREHLTGHKSFEEMVSTHIHVWREALGALLLNKAYDRSYVEHEQKALADIENACKIEMAAQPSDAAATNHVADDRNMVVGEEPVAQSITLTGAQLLEAFQYVAPDYPNDPLQLEHELTIQHGAGHSGDGMYCWFTDYPDEGSMLLDGTTVAPPQAQAVEQPLTDEPVETFLAEVRAELLRARSKFPGDRIMTIALAEEFGELCKAVLDESAANVRKEAVQTAVMCARVVLDGDGSVNDWRRERGLDQLVNPEVCLACKGRGHFVCRDPEEEWEVPCNGCNGTGRALQSAHTAGSQS